jgi:ATP-binding cassette subfamily B protein
VAVGVLLTLVLTIMTIALPKFKIVQKLTDRLNLVMRENLSGMMVIRAFNRQDFELNRFDKANKDITSVLLYIGRIMVVMMPVMMLIMNGVTVLIIWIGSHQVAQANMQVGDVIAFMQYTIQVVFSFLMMSMMFIILPGAVVSAGRIAEVLETNPVIKDPVDPKQFSDHFKGTVEFRNVSFRYPDAEEDILHDISFSAKPGQTTAFIGSTGSGKSTVVNLIPRFYDVTGGSILVDNLDIRDVTQHNLREKIGYIPQKGVLFSGTIESNLRYADENASMDLLREATDIAQATDFISDNGHDGFQTEISQGGTNVSGGQKQRLSIARALVKKPPIYIFDDSFSAVDFKTDAALRKALKNKTSASTLLIVTQRVSTIKNAEQIIVLDEGRIIGKGTHRELMRDCQEYQEIALSQLSQEELL